MRFLIAIKEMTDESKHILDCGINIANGFSADLSVIYVGNKPKGLVESEVAITRKSMEDWNIFHPGFEVLTWAFEYIREKGFIHEDHQEINPANIIDDKDRIRLILPRASGQKVRLILREGTLLNELKRETEFKNYELAIVGNPLKKRMTHKLIQFLNTSIFVVKNFNPQKEYGILLCVDDSYSTKRAVIFGSRISHQYGNHVRVITVSKNERFGKGYRSASKWARRYLRKMKVPHEVGFIIGDPSEVFISEAGDNNIIVMGKGTRNEFFKFIRGSKPIHTAQRANCPVLIVKS